MHAPQTTHLEATFRNLRYLKSALRKGLLFSNNGHVKVKAYANVDWIGSVTDKHSTSNYCSFVCGNLVT